MTPTARTLRIEVPGVPVAQPRPRATIAGGHARVYGAPSRHPVNVFKAAVQQAASQVHSGGLIDEPLQVEIVCLFPRPKSLTWKRREMPRVVHSKKPDAENVAKAVLDALTGVVYVDDAQVWRVSVEKWICHGDESPRCVVTVRG